MAVLSKVRKPENFESHNSQKLSCTNVRGFRSNFVECQSFLESNSPDILSLCERNLDDSIDSGNFSVKGYISIIRKVSITHMHSLAVYVKERPPFARYLSLENSADSYFCFRLALLHSRSYFLFLYRSPSSSLCTVFLKLFLLTQMRRFCRSTHLLMCLSLEASTSIIRTGYPILMELIDLMNSVIIFLSQITLRRWLTFL